MNYIMHKTSNNIHLTDARTGSRTRINGLGNRELSDTKRYQMMQGDTCQNDTDLG